MNAPLEAAEWFTAMQSRQVSAAERARFLEWLAQSAENVNEYLQMASVWRDLGNTAVPTTQIEALVALARRDAASGNVVDLRTNVRAKPEKRGRRLRVAAAAAALLMAGAAAWFWADGAIYGQRYSTGIGEQTAFSLPDGSVVNLNTRSKMRAHMSASERRIELIEGEAMFQVAKDPARPFRVYAGATVAQAVGTVFNVYRQDNAATVTVIEGKVLVAAHELEARGQARVSDGGEVRTASNVALEPITAWKDRKLIFEGESLREIVQEFNRYNALQLRVEDPELARIRISAVFGATDPNSLIEFLQRTERVQVRRDGDDRLLHR